jgi:phage tail protein X
MFNNQDEYTQAIQNSRLNNYPLKSKINMNFFILNLFIFMAFILVGYLGFDYLERHNEALKNTRVMGVSYTNTNYKMKESDLMERINELNDEVITLKQEVSMKKVVDNLIEASEDDNSAYAKSTVTKYNKSLRTILVQHGDTLASLSEEFYGTPQAFHKIINANSSLSNESHVIYVGEKIYIPY